MIPGLGSYERSYNFYIINDDGTYTPVCDSGQIQNLSDETILAINKDWALTSPANKITDAVLSAEGIFYHNYYGDFADMAYRRFYESGYRIADASIYDAVYNVTNQNELDGVYVDTPDDLNKEDLDKFFASLGIL